jgi:hypothetical protein
MAVCDLLLEIVVYLLRPVRLIALIAIDYQFPRALCCSFEFFEWELCPANGTIQYLCAPSVKAKCMEHMSARSSTNKIFLIELLYANRANPWFLSHLLFDHTWWHKLIKKSNIITLLDCRFYSGSRGSIPHPSFQDKDYKWNYSNNTYNCHESNH